MWNLNPELIWGGFFKVCLSSFWLMVVSDEVKTKHKNDETECWISRPLDDVLLEYAAFDVMQLRGIYSLYQTYLLRYPHIKVESQRYVNMFRNERRIKNCWYLDHGVLPQEILERTAQTKTLYDHLGTHNCGGCGRELHQESFGLPFRMWQKGQLCYTCVEARRFRSNPPPVRVIGRRYWRAIELLRISHRYLSLLRRSFDFGIDRIQYTVINEAIPKFNHRAHYCRSFGNYVDGVFGRNCLLIRLYSFAGELF
jgi:hypothetical protein